MRKRCKTKGVQQQLERGGRRNQEINLKVGDMAARNEREGATMGSFEMGS
jgi:hypothetical protein